MKRDLLTILLSVITLVVGWIVPTYVAQAHHEHYTATYVAEKTSTSDVSTNNSALQQQKERRVVSDHNRQVAFFECEMLLHLALHAPTPLQGELVDLAFADNRLVLKTPGGPSLQELEQLRREVRSTLREHYPTYQLRWSDSGVHSTNLSSLELAQGLSRYVLLEIANDTDIALDLQAHQVQEGETESTKYTVHPQFKVLIPVEVISHSLGDQQIKIAISVEGDAGSAREIELPVRTSKPAILRGKLFDDDLGESWPGRVYVEGSDHAYRHGIAYADNETLTQKQLLQFWNLGRYYKLPFFYSDGTFEVQVPPGQTEVTLERGFEHEVVSQKFDLKPGENRQIELRSGRLVDMRERGWISGDTHIHWVTNQWNVDMPLELLSMVQRAEDLRVANNLTLLQRGPTLAFINPQQAPMGTVQEFSDDQYHIEMGEEYRNEDLYGHLCFLNLDWLVQPIGTGSIIAGPDALDYPINKTAILACREQGGISCEAHGLGGNKDVPVNIVHDLTDSLDQIAPGDYYDFLDCGFHLPLTNGSDHPARVAGCARAYVKVEGDYTYDKWIDGIRQCRTFTSSGPLIFLTVKDAEIGDTIQAAPKDILQIRAEVISRYPIGNFQIVSNGEIIKSVTLQDSHAVLEFELPTSESRWIVARCSPSETFNAIEQSNVAHTSAIYVDVNGQPRFAADKARRWISEMRKHIRDIRGKGRFANDAQMQEAIDYVESGIKRFESMIATKAGQQSHTRPHAKSPFQLVSSTQSKKKKILLIPTELDHAWATHMYRQGCELLAACLNNSPEVEAVVSPDFDWPQDPNVLKDVSSIVYYSCPAADIVFDPTRRAEFQQLMDSGVGFCAIHWATGTKDDKYGSDYLDLLGGWFSFAHSGLKVDKRPLHQVLPEHPICRGWKPYELRDEFYLDLKFANSAQPVLQVDLDGKQQTVAWAYERENASGGRSFGTTLAHFHDNFAIPAFRKAIVNGILWSAHADVPAEGATVDPASAEVQLPPAPEQTTEPAKPNWPAVEKIDAQPLLVQVQRLSEALDYIGNPLSAQAKSALDNLKQETDAGLIAKQVQDVLDPLCLAAVEVGNGKLAATARPGEQEIVENGWRSFLVKVSNRDGLTSRLHVESPNARSMPHAKQEDVESRWLSLSMFDGRPLSANLSGLELEYRIIQLYCRDQGKKTATLEFAIDAKPGEPGRQIREWRFDNDTDGWQALSQSELKVQDGQLLVTGTGDDPFIGAEVKGVAGKVVLRFLAETEQDGVGQVFWWTEGQPSPDGNRLVTFPLIPGGQQQYEIVLPVEGVLAGIRIDPNVKPCSMTFDWIDLSYAHRHGETWNSVPIRFDSKPAIPVTLQIADKEGEPAAAAFVIRDKLGRVYPEQSKRLAPDLFFHPQVYRLDGEVLSLPPGEYQVKCWRGPHSIPETKTLVVDDQATEFRYQVRRWIDPTEFGWWSGDHHIHAAGCLHYVNPTQGILPRDMLRQTMGEDMNVGCCLTWGPCFDYQKRFFTGEVDKASQYPYLIRYDVEVSGFGSHVSGHLNLLRLKEQIYPGGDSKDHWPTLGLNTLRWAKKQGAICGPAHSGHGLTNYVARVGDYEDGPQGLPHFNLPAFDGIGANEYIVDITHEVPGPDGQPIPAIDFISSMNTPRHDEWNMWYHSLNCGFRVRISGETDFPCMSGERVGIGRVYVKVDGKLNFDEWIQGIQDGRSYVSDGIGHIIDFEAKKLGDSEYVELGTGGSEIHATEDATMEFRAKCAVRAENQESVTVELISNGYPVATQNIVADGSLQDVNFKTKVSKSSWLALRVFPHVHTNPFFVLISNQPIRASRASAEWCLQGVEQCWREKQPTYALEEQQDARKAYEHARNVYQKILAECQE